MADTRNIVEAEHICKSYVGVQALDDVSITIKKGEIKCLAGENGCGKSTFVKIIAGVEPCTSGTIRINFVLTPRCHTGQIIPAAAICAEAGCSQDIMLSCMNSVTAYPQISPHIIAIILPYLKENVNAADFV